MRDRLIAGVDEVGRGPLAGPVISAAVILDPACTIPGLADSKVLSEKRREALYGLIRERALWAIGRAEVEEIDTLNILHASLLSMRQVVLALTIKAEYSLMVGMRRVIYYSLVQCFYDFRHFFIV